jgi:hypothetical protein
MPPLSASQSQRDLVYDFLFSLRGEDRTRREYERRVLSFVEETRPDEQQERKEILKDFLDRTRQDPLVHSGVDSTYAERFTAFFTLGNFFRRFYNISELRKLLTIWEAEFSCERPLFNHLQVSALRLQGGRDRCRRAMALAKDNWRDFPGHAGLANNYAAAVARCLLEGYCASDQILLQEAMQAIGEAERAEPSYAKFQRTKGLLQFLCDDVDAGMGSFVNAADFENPRAGDYALRMGEHRLQLTFLKARQELLTLRNQAGEIEKTVDTKIKENQVRSLEFLGFFAAVLALITSSVQLVLRETSLQESFASVLALGGVLLLTFGGFGFILHGKERWVPGTSMCAFGLLLLLLGFGIVVQGSPAAPVEAKSPAPPAAVTPALTAQH